MEKSILINKYSSDPDQKLLLSHIYDLMSRCNDRNVITVSNFLTEAEINAVTHFISAAACEKYMFFGGYNDAERKVIVFLPEYFSEDDIYSNPSLAEITYVTVSVNKFDASNAELSHRDVLGSLMGLGIERDSVGDIITDGSRAVFIIKTKLADYIKENLSKIGRYNVEVQLHDFYNIEPKQDFETASDTVASMRLDAVISSIYNLSRTSASEYITSGYVFVNGMQNIKPDFSVKEGDKLTLRGKGKSVIDHLDGISKKGRIRFTYSKYK